MTHHPPTGGLPHPASRLRKGTVPVPACGSPRGGPAVHCRIRGSGRVAVSRKLAAPNGAAANRVRGPECGHLNSCGPVHGRGRSGGRRTGSGPPQSPTAQCPLRRFRRHCRRLRCRMARATWPDWLGSHAVGTVRPESCRPAPQGSPRFPDYGFRCRSDVRTPPMRRSRS